MSLLGEGILRWGATIEKAVSMVLTSCSSSERSTQGGPLVTIVVVELVPTLSTVWECTSGSLYLTWLTSLQQSCKAVQDYPPSAAERPVVTYGALGRDEI